MQYTLLLSRYGSLICICYDAGQIVRYRSSICFNIIRVKEFFQKQRVIVYKTRCIQFLLVRNLLQTIEDRK